MLKFIGITTLLALALGCHAREAGAPDLPEVRLELADADLWGATRGIYAHPEERGKTWERPARLGWFAPGGESWSTDVGVRIHGGRSRALEQKSFRVYFDHGDGVIQRDLFGDGPARFARVIVRSVQTPARCLHTHVAESLFQDLGHLGSRLQPVTVVLNGRPWGIYSLRERFDDDFVRETLDHAGPFDLIRDGETEHGDGQGWLDFLAAVAAPADRSSAAWLAGVEAQFDLAGYMDWLIINIVGAAADNGGPHNVSLLRLADGPWRVLMWDEDDLFQPDNLRNDHWRWFAAADEVEYRRYQPPVQITGTWQTRAPWAALFRGLLENPVFRERFFARADELLAGELSVVRFAERVQRVVALHEPAIAAHAERWGWESPQDLHDHAAVVLAWYAERHGVVSEQLESFRAQW